ncbi:MAG: ornithine carbamoyltransferase [Actinobacteria bacterium]|nr:ornithine carbamoyltransferase [Actinomycetota bacterium]
MSVRHYLDVDALSAGELAGLLDLADVLKAGRGPREDLAGRSVGMIFEKPSTRTRVSFQVAVAELGGHGVVLNAADLQLGRGETIEDTGRVLSRYLHALVVRTHAQSRLEALATTATVPVVNALSDAAHPCQALADLQTVRERAGGLAGLTLAYLGDGNNVAHSLLVAGATAGMRVVVASPPAYQPDAAVAERAAALAARTGGRVLVTADPLEAATGADVVYTDVWASMGQDDEREDRVAALRPYRVDADVMAAADDDAIVLHCLPAHRGEEIAAEVIDGPSSAVWDQAENRLHTQKALLLLLLGEPGGGAT